MKNIMSIDEQKLTALKAYPVAYQLQQLRAWNDYTQEESASLIGIRQATVSMWERGLCIPNSRSLAKIISVYHLPDDFFDDVQLKRIQTGKRKSN